MVYGIVFSRYPMADSFRLIITKNLPIFVKKINYNCITWQAMLCSIEKSYNSKFLLSEDPNNCC